MISAAKLTRILLNPGLGFDGKLLSDVFLSMLNSEILRMESHYSIRSDVIPAKQLIAGFISDRSSLSCAMKGCCWDCISFPKNIISAKYFFEISHLLPDSFKALIVQAVSGSECAESSPPSCRAGGTIAQCGN